MNMTALANAIRLIIMFEHSPAAQRRKAVLAAHKAKK